MTDTQRWVGDGFVELDERIDYFIKFDREQNFGDYLPEIFCKELLAYPRIDADLFRLVGSVIDERWVRQDLSRTNGHIAGLIAYWCCGARGPTGLTPQTQSHCRFFGIRGPLSRDALGLPSDTVMGDPGLLAPLFHQPKPHPRTSGKVICIPHIQDTRPSADLLAMAGAETLVHPRIDASEAALGDLLDQIASADFVLSASLHGAIIACAYGRPFCFWDNGHLDVPFKWSDFAQSIGLEAVFAPDVAAARAVWADMAPRITIPPLAPILEVAPFTPQPHALLRALAHDSGDATLAAAATILAGASDRRRSETIADQQASAGLRLARKGLDYDLRRRAGTGARALKRRLQALRSR